MQPSPSLTRRIVASAGIIGASVLLSRVLGFFRNWTVAQQIGSNAATDAYFAAFTLPDFLNYLVAGGSLSLTFIPVIARCVAEKREEDAWHVFSTVITSMDILLAAGIALGEIFAPALVRVIAPGFHGPQRARVIFLTRLMLPAQIFFYQGGILSAVQYAKTKFVLPSLAPVVYNSCIIVAGVLLAHRIGITGFAVGVLVGAFAGNFALQLYGARRVGARFRPNLNVRNEDFRLFVKLSVPIMLGLSIVYTDDWIIRWFGSYLVPASITWLTYAKTLMQVPLGILGQAVGVASFPFFAQLYSEGRLEELNRTLTATLKGVILLVVPVSALTIVQRSPLVYFVFSHTRMHALDLQATAATLALFSVGMFAWGAQGILARGFYAARNTFTPVAVGTSIAFLSLPMYWALARHWQHLGLALSSSLAVMSYAFILFVLFNRRMHHAHPAALVWFFIRVTAAAAFAALVCARVCHILEAHIRWHSTHGAFLVLVGATASALPVAVAFMKLFRIHEVNRYLKQLGIGW